MENSSEKLIIDAVSDYYLSSGDFNGMSLHQLLNLLSLQFSKTKKIIIKLIRSGDLALISSESELNPHIIRTGFREVDVQISEIKNAT